MPEPDSTQMDRDSFRQKIERAIEIERLISKVALWIGAATIAFVTIVLFAYATKDTLVGQGWGSLRRGLAWLLPLYLVGTLGGLFVGCFAAWGASKPDIRRRGVAAGALVALSVFLLLAGRGLIG